MAEASCLSSRLVCFRLTGQCGCLCSPLLLSRRSLLFVRIILGSLSLCIFAFFSCGLRRECCFLKLLLCVGSIIFIIIACRGANLCFRAIFGVFFYRWTQEAEAAAPWITGSLTSEALIAFISNCFCHGGLA